VTATVAEPVVAPPAPTIEADAPAPSLPETPTSEPAVVEPAVAEVAARFEASVPAPAPGPSTPADDTPDAGTANADIAATDVADVAAPVAEPAPVADVDAPTTVDVDPAQEPAVAFHHVADRPAATEAPASTTHVDTPARPQVEQPVAEQVATKVTSLRLDEDGRHEVTLDLHPAELGSVGVDVVVDAGRVHVSIRAEQSGAAELLRSSIDELRRLLAEQGLDVAGCEVGSWQLAARDHGERPDQNPGNRAGGSGGGNAAAPIPDLASSPTRPMSTDSGVDVLL
jgi:flagellar hook-length control protein FliK